MKLNLLAGGYVNLMRTHVVGVTRSDNFQCIYQQGYGRFSQVCSLEQISMSPNAACLLIHQYS